MDKQCDETMALNTPAYCNAAIKPLFDNSLSTHSFQPKAIPDPNSKKMGTGSEVPWQITRSGIEEANRAQYIFVLRWQRASHTRPSGVWRILTWDFEKWAWVSYHGSIKGAHSLSGLHYASSSSERFDSEWRASSPTSRVVGSSKATSFPLRREEPWPFVGVIMKGLIGVNVWECLREKVRWRKGKGESVCVRNMKGISLKY